MSKETSFSPSSSSWLQNLMPNGEEEDEEHGWVDVWNVDGVEGLVAEEVSS